MGKPTTFADCAQVAENAGAPVSDAFEYFLWNETPFPFSGDNDADARKALRMATPPADLAGAVL
jgi:hypothetical protein